MPGTKKFDNPLVTLKGEPRAQVSLRSLTTLWFNTGTLCNLSCQNCYIESSPKNDRLSYITKKEVVQFLDEIEQLESGTKEIGFTGGEPFMNPEIIAMLEESLQRGFTVLILTNAMRPMMRHTDELEHLAKRYTTKLTIRVSLDHFDREFHDLERGKGSYDKTLEGLRWLSTLPSTLHVAGRTCWEDSEEELRSGFQTLFNSLDISIDTSCKKSMVLFPEMDETKEVPEITTACWDILNKHPDQMMCAHSRMVVKRKGDSTPSVMACTLLAYDDRFNLGSNLRDAKKTVYLNHHHCAKFCVLGGGSCSTP